MVDLHQFAGAFGALAVAPAARVAVEVAAPLGSHAAAAERTRLDAPQPHALGEDAPDGGRAECHPLAGEHHAQAALAHVRVPPPHGPNTPLGGARPAWSLHPPRPAAARRQRAHAAIAQRRAPAVVGAARHLRHVQRHRQRRAGGAQHPDLVEQRQTAQRLGVRGLVDARPAVACRRCGLDLHGSGLLVGRQTQGYPTRRTHRGGCGPPRRRAARSPVAGPRSPSSRYAAPPLRSGRPGDGPRGPATGLPTAVSTASGLRRNRRSELFASPPPRPICS